MNSMTGFGKAEVETPFGRLRVEASSVNNRFLEISVRMPRTFSMLEPLIRGLVSGILNRGKISIYVGFDESETLPGKYTINEKALTAYVAQLRAAAAKLKMPADIRLESLLALPDVSRPDEDLYNVEDIWPGLESGVTKALKEMAAMRLREGKELQADMKKRLKLLQTGIGDAEKISLRAVGEYRQKVTRRIEELLEHPLPDTVRLEEEIAMMAERTDISEECTRFRSHLKQFQAALGEKGPVGKRLNFLLQELNREANTLSSKSTAVDIGPVAISLKEEIERLREQVQNVE